jgi:beta-phosphoglucomutase-like phosphatase (HAD superfamily)
LEPRLAHSLGAVIFDMDGVLADTEPIQEAALAAFLELRGKSLSPNYYAETIGLDYRAFWTDLIARYGLSESVEECVSGYEPMLLGRLVGLEAAPGATELVRALKAAGVPMAVASSSFRPVVEATLGAIGLREAFNAVVSGDEVTNGKPAPEIYLRAAGRLGVEPGRCVAIEDSANGVRAAIAAGMACLGIVTAYSTSEQLRATRTVRSLSEVVPGDLAEMAGDRA